MSQGCGCWLVLRSVFKVRDREQHGKIFIHSRGEIFISLSYDSLEKVSRLTDDLNLFSSSKYHWFKDSSLLKKMGYPNPFPSNSATVKNNIFGRGDQS